MFSEINLYVLENEKSKCDENNDNRIDANDGEMNHSLSECKFLY